MILHTLNAAPSSAVFLDCVKCIHPGDAVVLMGDGVYAALAGTVAQDSLSAANVELYVLRADAEAAGVAGRLGAVQLIDVDDLVALTERYSRQQAWY